MLNKLKNTTALVGALSIAASASYAETKITAALEQTLHGHSQDLAARKINGSSGFGTETTIAINSGKDLAGGWKATYGFDVEMDGTGAKSDYKYLTLSSGAFSLTVGEDVGDNLQSTVIPFVSDNFETIGGSTGAGLNFESHGSGLNVHERAHIGANYKFPGGQATLRYAPNNAGPVGDSYSDASSTTAKGTTGGTSAMEYLISGKTAGVGYRLGRMDGGKADSANAGGDNDYTVYGLSYGMSGFTVAAEKRITDRTTTAATAEKTATQYGVAYATKDFSAGIYMLKNEQDATATEEEAKMIQVGYNMGGLGIDISYAQIENAGFANGADADVWQIRTIQKF